VEYTPNDYVNTDCNESDAKRKKCAEVRVEEIVSKEIFLEM
jgi:hypothetical protein